MYFLIIHTHVHVYTDTEISLLALLVEYYNDLFGRQSFVPGRDEFSYFYVGDFFSKYANFQEKIFAGISRKKFQTL